MSEEDQLARYASAPNPNGPCRIMGTVTAVNGGQVTFKPAGTKSQPFVFSTEEAASYSVGDFYEVIVAVDGNGAVSDLLSLKSTAPVADALYDSFLNVYTTAHAEFFQA